MGNINVIKCDFCNTINENVISPHRYINLRVYLPDKNHGLVFEKFHDGVKDSKSLIVKPSNDSGFYFCSTLCCENWFKKRLMSLNELFRMFPVKEDEIEGIA